MNVCFLEMEMSLEIESALFTGVCIYMYQFVKGE